MRFCAATRKVLGEGSLWLALACGGLAAMACVQEGTVLVGQDVAADGVADGGGLDAGDTGDLAGPTDADDTSDAGGPDAADLDAGADDGSRVDAPVDAGPDAADVGPDAIDAGVDLADTGSDADTGWGPCSVNGVPGECLETAECTGDRSPTPGFCPGPANIQCCTPNDGEACDPEAMPQPNAGLEELAGVGGCPDGMVPVDADFCIDQYEAALVEVLAGGATQPWSPYHNPGTRRVRAVSLPGAVPQGYVNGEQAADACDEAEKRLCTDAEFLRACRGSGGTNAYPYGPTQVVGWCNENRPVHPAVELYGTTASWIYSELDNACLNQLPASLARTGDYAECVSAETVYDLVGNLHEWTADPAGTFRGGYYVDTWRNGLGCSYATTAHNTLHWDYSTGFRCCADR